jgi:PIN domain nuclease of toxin-antitoxin system
MLNAKGRIRSPEDPWVAGLRGLWPKQEAPLTHEIVLAARQMCLSHSDPADRFLAATAQLLRLTLVTADANLVGLGNISTLSNR